MTLSTPPVWFITGCSSGLGKELVRAILAKGGRVAVTARDRTRLGDLVRDAGDRALTLDLDVTKRDQIIAAVAAAESHFGRIDVLVNNAGYGYQATAEEGQEDEIRRQFDTNVFALFAVTRAVLPGMRTRQKGHVINITSVAGMVGFPGSGYYAASKHAVEGWSDSLSAECRPLGIRVTCVEPGPFRTNWAGSSLRQTPSRIAAYADTAGVRLLSTAAASGTQPGDPVRAAEIMIRIVESNDPPRHLVLGAVGVAGVTAALEKRLEEVKAWSEAGRATDFPGA